MAPSLSIVVICRNYARYVAACLRSILVADQASEVVFLDNGSKDDSAEVARETLREAPSHISSNVIALTPERPLCAALNLAVAQCSGEFIKLISADDMLGPNFFTSFRQLVTTSDRSVGVWLAGSVVIDNADNVLRQYYEPNLFGAPDDGPPKRLEERHVLHNPSSPRYSAPSMFYRRKAYDDIGGYDERFRFEDRPFLFDVLKGGWTVLVHPYNNTYYRVHGQGISANPMWMAEARLPILFNHAFRAEWHNKPIAFFHLARGVRFIAMKRWRERRAASK